MLSACGLTLRRGRRRVFERLDLTLHPGITVLLGPNGAGKSTLLQALANPRDISSGDLLLDGGSVLESRGSEREYLGDTGFMPQRWRFFPGFTVSESVEYVAWLKRMSRDAIRDAALRALDTVRLSERRHDRVSRLSGGMRQRVGLAETLVNSPAVVLLDEPTVGLDPAQRSVFRAALREGAGDRITLLSTHLTDDVAVLADRVIVIDDGRVLFDGAPADLSARGSGDGEAPSRIESGYLALLAEHEGARP